METLEDVKADVVATSAFVQKIHVAIAKLAGQIAVLKATGGVGMQDQINDIGQSLIELKQVASNVSLEADVADGDAPPAVVPPVDVPPGDAPPADAPVDNATGLDTGSDSSNS